MSDANDAAASLVPRDVLYEKRRFRPEFVRGAECRSSNHLRLRARSEATEADIAALQTVGLYSLETSI